ncbi:MAG: HD domain-containing protein [Candidatus Accumulibacter sp.]|jgi:hypothetical protein|nr:HD domain-containing protein [Accumulibacter sp.]
MPHVSREELLHYLPEISLFGREDWRETVCAIWREAYAESAWSDLADVPFSVAVSTVNLVDHVRMVTGTALELARNVRERMRQPCDSDKVLLLCLLHDVCKIVENEPDPDHPGQPRKSRLGKTCQHGFMSGYYARRHGLPDDVVGDLIAHSGWSRVVPGSSEALCMYYADMGAADQAFFFASQPLLLKK